MLAEESAFTNPAVILVCFGTSYQETREKTLQAIETDVREAFPMLRVYHAWSSRLIRQKLKERDHEFIPDVSCAMKQMHRDGVTDVVVQPTYMINGIEYEQMLADVACSSPLFRQVRVGTALLTSPEDCDAVIRVVTEEIPINEDEALVLMGHGTAHTANIIYRRLDTRFKELGYGNIHLGTVESASDPDTIGVLLQASRPARVILAPFLMVAGDHTKNDLCGDAETSWKQRFLSAGYSVECRLRGLGEYPGIRRLILSHLQDAMVSQSRMVL